MDTKVNYTIVGLFMITLFAALVMGVIWLSSGFTIKHYKKYMVYMRDSVSGLNIQSPVEYNGVEVGSVIEIKLNHRDPQIVELMLEIDSSTPITTATIATIKSRGITGVTFVSLKDENDTRTPLVAKRGEPYPVIKSGPSLFSRIDTMLDELSKNVHDVARSINKLLDPQNQRTIKQILSNMDEITGELAANSGKMTVILNNTSAASKQFNELIRSGTSTLRVLRTQTLPATYRVMTNIDHMTQDLATFSNELKQNPSVLLRGRSPAPLGPGEQR